MTREMFLELWDSQTPEHQNEIKVAALNFNRVKHSFQTDLFYTPLCPSKQSEYLLKIKNDMLDNLQRTILSKFRFNVVGAMKDDVPTALVDSLIEVDGEWIIEQICISVLKTEEY